ncbi:Uncharacterised protein [Yersinia mollaretii]|nr:Uncharacterised protein [Yersinia mollaretii]
MTWVNDGSQQPCNLKDDGYKLIISSEAKPLHLLLK